MNVRLLLAALAFLIPRIAWAAPHTVTIVLKDFRLEPPSIQLTVGEEVALTLRNEGRVAHEWLIGSSIVRTPEEKGFQRDLLALLKPKVEGHKYSLERAGRRAPGQDDPSTRISTGLQLQPGGEVTLLFAVPANVQGEWEMGCLFPGHYESGMKGMLIIR